MSQENKEISRDRFTFYKSYYDTYKELPPKDKLEFIETIMSVYFLEKKLEDITPSTPMLKLAFSSISHSIKTSIKGLFDKLKINYETYPWQGGTEGAYQDPSQQQTISNRQQAIDNIEHTSRFKEPTLEEITEYAKSRNRVDIARKFYDYFTEGNWTDSRGKKVKNWKQKFITWEAQNIHQSPPSKSSIEKRYS